MAVIDPLTDAVVIRVIYDGAPFAGKTTSVRALGSGLGSAVTSPGEIAGRTLFFDWLDYTGGLFEGRRIRCQIVSVPGQAVLAPRRKRLLDSADVVVYVLDSSAAAFASERGYLEGLKATLNRRSGPPIGVVVQANKRDLPDAVALTDLRQMLESVGFTAAVVETNAAAGNGIRESFVLAVRLALDRVRELLRLGELKTAPPEINDHEALLNDLQSNDEGLSSLNDLHELPHTRMSDLAPLPATTHAPTSAMSAASAATELSTASRVEPHSLPGSDNVAGSLAPATLPPASEASKDVSAMEKAPLQSIEAAPAPPTSIASLPLAAQALMEALADNQAAAENDEPPAGEIASASSARVADDTPADTSRPPRVPDDRVASGLIWPVVVGRTILNEISSSAGVELALTPSGGWRAEFGGRWQLDSAADAGFADLEHGREALVRWARMHVATSAILTSDRCIVLSNDHGGRFRLWQVYRREPSLAEKLDTSSRERDAQPFAVALLACSIALSDIHSRLELIDFPITAGLPELTLREHRVVLCGRMPPPAASGGKVAVERPSLEAVFDTEFAAVRLTLESRRCELSAFLEQSPSVIRQSLVEAAAGTTTLASYVRQASPDRLEQAILQLTALMVAV